MIYVNIDHANIKNYSALKKKLSEIQQSPIPAFHKYKEDIPKLKKEMSKYKKYKNLILIGHGGSNTSLKAYHQALTPLDSEKKLFILTTVEPDLLVELRKDFSKRNTLVMPISKSGTTITALEALFSLLDYEIIPVTGEGGTLFEIAKQKKSEIILHPSIGGRFSGLTSCAFAPALFFDIDVQQLEEGARNMYSLCSPTVKIDKNPALQIASVLYLLEKKGYEEVFCPIYSSKLIGFENLIVQLMHESICKHKKARHSFVQKHQNHNIIQIKDSLGEKIMLSGFL